MRLAVLILAFFSSLITIGLVQEQTGRISIGGAQGGWITQTVSEFAGPDTTYYWRATGRQDEVIASEYYVQTQIALALGNPTPTPTPEPTPTPTPTPTPSPTPLQYTLTAPATAKAGVAMSVSFTAPAGHSTLDWIGLFRVTDGAFISWQYIGNVNSGSLSFTAPTKGTYEFGLYLNNAWTRVATSSRVAVF